MRIGPKRIICCHGIAGVICLADWINHALMHSCCHGLCDRHEKNIDFEYIVEHFWTA